MTTHNRYTVHCFVSVRVKLTDVEATSYRDAIEQAIAKFDWDLHRQEAEYADEFIEFLVDVDGDEAYSQSQWFDGCLKEISLVSQPHPIHDERTRL
jgi:hypothetical protein